MTAGEIAEALGGARQSGNSWQARCPAHHDRDPSLSLTTRNGQLLVHCFGGCTQRSVIEALKARGLWPDTRHLDEVEPKLKWGLLGWQHQYLRERIEELEAKYGWKHTAIYPYFDADNRLAYVKVRFLDKQNDKTFRQYALSSKGGWVSRSKAGKEPILYRLNALTAADEIFIVNGEKAADRGAAELGIVTTCSPDGEGKWCAEFTRPLISMRIRIIVDNDEKGEKHGQIVSTALAPYAAEVKIIRLPGLPPKGDLWDWIEAGGTKEQLQAIVDATPPIKPETTTEAPATNTQNKTGAAGSSLLTQLLNDVGNAERLILMCGHKLRYCPPMRKWLAWGGRRWAIDDQGTARYLAKQTMLAYLDQALTAQNKDHIQFALKSLNSVRINSMLTMAQCEPTVVIMPDKLDTHPFLLNFFNGTVDLRTGELMPHNQSHYLTKLVHYNYNPQAECPRFRDFIARIMGNHPDASEPELDRAERMVYYLQRAFGYSLTGVTSEKAMSIPFGSGNNGKTTLLSTFLRLLEEYFTLLRVDTLMVRQDTNNTHADLADLRGARFVMTSETEEAQRLSLAKLKRVVQGVGKIKAVRKYENPIELPETHKLWMDTNFKPTIRAVDDKATFNRLHPIPFSVTIPAEEIDKDLPQKLLAEAEGILAWAVEGAKLWWQQGLGRPPEIDQARDTWRAENDQLGRFLEESCVIADDLSSRSRQLYECYRTWAEGAGEYPIAETLFGRRLTDRGFRKVHREHGTFYIGIALRRQGEAA